MTDERELVRLIHGELPPERARRLAGEIERDPELAARHRRLAALWESLELPPPTPVPPGFAARVTARLPAEREAAPPFGSAPVWVRWSGAAALALGLWVGVVAGGELSAAAPEAAEVEAAQLQAVELEAELAESYLAALEEGTAEREAAP